MCFPPVVFFRVKLLCASSAVRAFLGRRTALRCLSTVSVILGQYLLRSRKKKRLVDLVFKVALLCPVGQQHSPVPVSLEAAVHYSIGFQVSRALLPNWALCP